MTFHLSVLTPDALIYQGDIVSVIVPGSLGSMEVLKNHAALITSLSEGKVQITKEGKVKETYFISGGFFEVSKNEATLLADSWEKRAG